ncbi:MAG: GNAT family N-acetyltransferase [Gammaproteobacteria bacterium]|nr:MAG: GNAT family N-acetyltransferase [Gammaproteobacteria bacterium]
MHLIVRQLNVDDINAFNEHIDRHLAESGRGENHFMPYAPSDPNRPTRLKPTDLDVPLNECSWKRWFLAIDVDENVVGHADLKGDDLRTGLHRCELGIGVEREYREQGLGRRLLEESIAFARTVDSIDWIDLRVFSHNTVARRLYESIGFKEVVTVFDRFRIEESQIDDVLMSLSVV